MIPIFYEDKALVVCEKPVGVLSERGQNPRERCMPVLLEQQTRAYRIDTVHRLDKAVGGVMVYSKQAAATAELSRQIARHQMVKEYYAVVSGAPDSPQGEWRDWLFRDKAKNKSFVVNSSRRGVKEAVLNYTVLQTISRPQGPVTLLKIALQTGRTHQIRVQCASRKMPLLGDEKYGSRIPLKNIALYSCHLAFSHPITRKPVEVTACPTGETWNWFDTLTKTE